MPDHYFPSGARSIPGISPAEAWHRMQDEGATLIDVREPQEFALGHAEGAISIPLSVFRERYQEISPAGDVLVICHVGQRSLIAAAALRNQGREHIFNVEGGTDAWEAMRLPMQYPG
jgi:rhodanese-related sulfurtransferase